MNLARSSHEILFNYYSKLDIVVLDWIFIVQYNLPIMVRKSWFAFGLDKFYEYECIIGPLNIKYHNLLSC